LVLVSEIANRINGEIEGNSNLEIRGVCDIKDGIEGKITFLGNSKYLPFLNSTKSSVVIIDRSQELDFSSKTFIRVDNPHLGFAQTLEIFQHKVETKANIHPSAIIDKSVIIGENVSIGPNVIIEKGSNIGKNCLISGGVFIDKNCHIGENCTINPNGTIYFNSQIGNNVNIDSGTVIGADGFGWVTEKGKHYKIPHIGNVEIADNVWIGANCTIDRGTFKSTKIGHSCKLDNQIHIAHNVILGINCLIAGQTGIAGSTIIEDNVTIAGQCGIGDNLRIGKNSIIAAKSAILQSLPSDSFVSGNPARNHKNRIKQEFIIQQLPEILMRIRNLENNFEVTKE
jgi:UDP-3-O-[3-hydroxymyristoyl] glucosamine N-acyltransferase